MPEVFALSVPERAQPFLLAALEDDVVKWEGWFEGGYEYAAWTKEAVSSLGHGGRIPIVPDGRACFSSASHLAFVRDALLHFHELAMGDGEYRVAADLLELVADIADGEKRMAA